MEIVYRVSKKRSLFILTDLLLIVASYAISYVLRFYPDLGQHLFLLDTIHFILLLFPYLFTFYIFQIYRIIWEYSNINDVYKLGLANVAGFLLFIFIVFVLRLNYSRLVFILTFFFILIGTIFYRVLIRDYFSKRRNRNNHKEKAGEGVLTERRILIAGAGEAGRTILAELSREGLGKNVVGFIDDDPLKIGKILNGKKIFDNTGNVDKVAADNNVDEVLIAMPSAGSEVINRMVTHIRRTAKDISIKTLPSIIELLGKRPLIGSLRSISIDDLLGREEVKVDVAGIEKNYKDKVVLVTGAGGSIGAEICKQLLNFKIKKLIAIDRSEFTLYTLIKEIQRDMGYLGYKPDIIYRVVDIKDSHLMDKVYSETRPDTVFHAAAHKHVPLMEYNEAEAFRNNVGGTLQLLNLSKKHKVDKFVLVSTDKSVYPVSVMGVTKRIAELVTLYYHNEKGLSTAIVRFGNVIGSRGSVIPLFQEQIKSGGPVTVTHRDMKRFFMTIPEASILVINASVYSKGGEIFVLDMGKQHRVLDIARNLIRFYGYEPGKDIEIVFTGLRPGEKLYEELFYKKECMRETENEKILILDSRGEDYNKAAIEKLLGMDLDDVYGYDAKSIRCFMKQFVAEYDFNNLHECKDDGSKLVN